MLNGKRGGGVVKGGLGVVLGWWPSGCWCAEGAAAVFSAPGSALASASCTHLSGAVQLWWLAMVQCNTKNQFRNTTSGPLGYPPSCADALTAALYRRAAANIPQCPTFLHQSPHNCISLWPMAHMPNA